VRRRAHRHQQRRRAAEREPDEQAAGQVQRRKHEEVAGQPDRIGERRRQQPAEQVAGDVAGDVGGERTRHLLRAAVLGEVGQHQRECRRHAQPLHDPQRGEDRKVRRERQQRGRHRQQRQRDEDAAPAVDVALLLRGARALHHVLVGAGLAVKDVDRALAAWPGFFWPWPSATRLSAGHSPACAWVAPKASAMASTAPAAMYRSG
jgi:hypothetical protein